MERLIGIMIPDDIKAKIEQFCKQYEPNPAEPYMAMITPGMMEPIKGIDRKMQSFCLGQPPFAAIIGEPNLEHWDGGTVLYLSVMLGPLNIVRDKLVNHLRIKTGAFFRAQLVLVSRGANSEYDFDTALADAKEAFSKAQEFSVTALAVYSRENEDENFKVDATYQFTGR